MRVGCAILAAGSGSRFGGSTPKMIAPLRGKPLLQYAIDSACASPAVRCSLVLGARADAVRFHIAVRRCAVLVNEDWSDGISASIRVAVTAHALDDACILMLGDQPRVSARDLRLLIEAGQQSADTIVALRSGEIWGAPVLFRRLDYPALLALRGDTGAKRYARAQQRRLVFVDAEHRDAFADVDRRADLRKF